MKEYGSTPGSKQGGGDRGSNYQAYTQNQRSYKLDYLDDGKASERSGNSMVSRSLGNLMEDQLGADEMDEMQVYTLEQELLDVKRKLNESKFKYEQK